MDHGKMFEMPEPPIGFTWGSRVSVDGIRLFVFLRDGTGANPIQFEIELFGDPKTIARKIVDTAKQVMVRLDNAANVLELLSLPRVKIAQKLPKESEND